MTTRPTFTAAQYRRAKRYSARRPYRVRGYELWGDGSRVLARKRNPQRATRPDGGTTISPTPQSPNPTRRAPPSLPFDEPPESLFAPALPLVAAPSPARTPRIWSELLPEMAKKFNVGMAGRAFAPLSDKKAAAQMKGWENERLLPMDVETVFKRRGLLAFHGAELPWRRREGLKVSKHPQYWQNEEQATFLIPKEEYLGQVRDLFTHAEIAENLRIAWNIPVIRTRKLFSRYGVRMKGGRDNATWMGVTAVYKEGRVLPPDAAIPSEFLRDEGPTPVIFLNPAIFTGTTINTAERSLALFNTNGQHGRLPNATPKEQAVIFMTWGMLTDELLPGGGLYYELEARSPKFAKIAPGAAEQIAATKGPNKKELLRNEYVVLAVGELFSKGLSPKALAQLVWMDAFFDVILHEATHAQDSLLGLDIDVPRGRSLAVYRASDPEKRAEIRSSWIRRVKANPIPLTGKQVELELPGRVRQWYVRHRHQGEPYLIPREDPAVHAARFLAEQLPRARAQWGHLKAPDRDEARVTDYDQNVAAYLLDRLQAQSGGEVLYHRGERGEIVGRQRTPSTYHPALRDLMDALGLSRGRLREVLATVAVEGRLRLRGRERQESYFEITRRPEVLMQTDATSEHETPTAAELLRSYEQDAAELTDEQAEREAVALEGRWHDAGFDPAALAASASRLNPANRGLKLKLWDREGHPTMPMVPWYVRMPRAVVTREDALDAKAHLEQVTGLEWRLITYYDGGQWVLYPLQIPFHRGFWEPPIGIRWENELIDWVKGGQAVMVWLHVEDAEHMGRILAEEIARVRRQTPIEDRPFLEYYDRPQEAEARREAHLREHGTLPPPEGGVRRRPNPEMITLRSNPAGRARYRPTRYLSETPAYQAALGRYRSLHGSRPHRVEAIEAPDGTPPVLIALGQADRISYIPPRHSDLHDRDASETVYTHKFNRRDLVVTDPEGQMVAVVDPAGEMRVSLEGPKVGIIG